MSQTQPVVGRAAVKHKPGPVISLTGISKVYPTTDGNLATIADVSFDVRAQEFVSVLGPSGCGKTTILRLIAGLTDTTAGRVEVNGAAVKGPRRDVGIVFQVPALMKWRTALANVVLPLELIGVPKAAALDRAKRMLDLVGLTEFAGRYPMELSGGMQQRVGIARALVHEPSILLLDEPFSALDVMTRSQLNLELLRIWSEQRKTSLLITHSIPEAVFLSDRVVVLSPRPARVLDVVAIDLPRPRRPETRVAPAFTTIVDKIGRMIGLDSF
jgi:NitT/TauT family transport system ATP-binding protein